MLHRERKLVKGPNWLAKPYIYTRKTSSVSVRVARVDSEQLELRKALRHQSSAWVLKAASSKTAVFKRASRHSKPSPASNAKPLASVHVAVRFKTRFSQLIRFHCSPHINTRWLSCVLILREASQVSGVQLLVFSSRL